MTKKQWVIVCVGLVAVSLTVFVWTRYAKAPVSEQPISELSSVSSTTPPVATTSTPIAPKPAIAKFPINPTDTITSWSFKGAYVGNDALIAQANADIAKLTDLIGKGKYDDYDLYNGIANDYSFLGDGKTSYQNYNRAISIHPKKGLAYANLGYLMDGLGAYHTAADAYAKAVAVEPSAAQYQNSQIDFLASRFPEEAARLKAKQ